MKRDAIEWGLLTLALLGSTLGAISSYRALASHQLAPTQVAALLRDFEARQCSCMEAM